MQNIIRLCHTSKFVFKCFFSHCHVGFTLHRSRVNQILAFFPFVSRSIFKVSFYLQSEVWVDDAAEKEKLIKAYKDALRYKTF